MVKDAHMKINRIRIQSALKAMGVHFVLSVLIAGLVALLVFAVWFPYPYREFAGGKDLFLLIVGVDLVCGPLLTLVLYNPSKPKRELVTDMGLVVLLQLAALCYGAWTMYQVRPLYLVHEIDRFKVISLADVDATELANMPDVLKVRFFEQPKIVSLRELSPEERKKVMFESVAGGRDYGDHPNFYRPYAAAQAYAKAKPLADFVKKYPDKQTDVGNLSVPANIEAKQLRYLPIMARQDWVAVLNSTGEVVGYLRGDGF
jgi:hypothetical protein